MKMSKVKIVLDADVLIHFSEGDVWDYCQLFLRSAIMLYWTMYMRKSFANQSETKSRN